MLGKIEGRGRRGIIEYERLDMSLSKLWETVKDRETWRAAVHESDTTAFCKELDTT